MREVRTVKCTAHHTPQKWTYRLWHMYSLKFLTYEKTLKLKSPSFLEKCQSYRKCQVIHFIWKITLKIFSTKNYFMFSFIFWKLIFIWIWYLKTTAAMAKNRMRNTKWYFKIRKVFLYAVKISLSLFFSSKHIN